MVLASTKLQCFSFFNQGDASSDYIVAQPGGLPFTPSNALAAVVFTEGNCEERDPDENDAKSEEEGLVIMFRRVETS